jgi:hypothetical protein
MVARRGRLRHADLSDAVLATIQADRLRFDRAKPIKASASGGKGDEIYFSDFRKTDPSKLRTILRQPVAEAPL